MRELGDRSQPRLGVGHGQCVWGLRTALEWRQSLLFGLEGSKLSGVSGGHLPVPTRARALFPSHPDGAAGTPGLLSALAVLNAIDGGGGVRPSVCLVKPVSNAAQGPGRGSAVPSEPSAGPQGRDL